MRAHKKGVLRMRAHKKGVLSLRALKNARFRGVARKKRCNIDATSKNASLKYAVTKKVF
jgi:hypothetical protein